MKLKHYIQAASLCLATTVCQTAFAQKAYVPILNTALNTSGLSCAACHNTSPKFSGYNTPNLTTIDSDGDLVTNGIEVRMSTAFNDVNDKPAAGALSASGGVYITTVTAPANITTTTVTNLAVETNSFATLSGSDTILGGISISPTLPSAGTIELAFEGFGIATAKVYQVVGGTTSELTPVTVNAKGSITFTTTSAVPKLLIVGTASSAGATANGDASIYGCMTSSVTTPLMMFLAMLSLGLFVRRKKD